MGGCEYLVVDAQIVVLVQSQPRDAQTRSEDERVSKQWRQIVRLSDLERIKSKQVKLTQPDKRAFEPRIFMKEREVQ